MESNHHPCSSCSTRFLLSNSKDLVTTEIWWLHIPMRETHPDLPRIGRLFRLESDCLSVTEYVESSGVTDSSSRERFRDPCHSLPVLRTEVGYTERDVRCGLRLGLVSNRSRLRHPHLAIPRKRSSRKVRRNVINPQ